MIPTIGRGDPRVILQNCLDVTETEDQVLILVRNKNGEHYRWGTQIDFDALCAMSFLLSELVSDCAKGLLLPAKRGGKV